MSGGRRAGYAGRAGEAAAERLYLARGATVLARRWRRREGEIDLVLREGATVVFAEVKVRRTAAAAAAAIGGGQTRRLAAAAARFLAERALTEAHVRIDVVLVDETGDATLIENALGFDEW
jgi:putative endonuclease